MDLDQDAESAERELEDHNERLDELALFGIGTATGSNVDPVDVDAAPVTASSSPTATGGSTARDNRPRKRLATSRVWADFEEVTGLDDKGCLRSDDDDLQQIWLRSYLVLRIGSWQISICRILWRRRPRNSNQPLRTCTLMLKIVQTRGGKTKMWKLVPQLRS